MGITKYRVVDDDGNTWEICVDYEEVCTRKGSFSCLAEDPDEYYGEFEFRYLGVEYAEMVEAIDEESYEWYDAKDVPEWMKDLAEEMWRDDFL